MCDDAFTCPRRPREDTQRDADSWRESRWHGNEARWPEAVPMPRTCSHCGGLHADDALELIIDGWHLENVGTGHDLVLKPCGVLVTPPAMMFLEHWTREQCQRADAVLRGRRVYRSAIANKAGYFL